ncbi:MAG: lipoyl(octanoyl) transferase LipB [Pseudomonadota bacterium]
MTDLCPLDTQDNSSVAQLPPVLWRVSESPVPYPDAVEFMETQIAGIRAGTASEMVWLLQHPPIYTAGTSARPQDLLEPGRFPVHETGRGGQYTYHGPGQLVAYVMLDLNKRGPDVRKFVCNLEKWLKDTLAVFGVTGETREGRVGTWVRRADNSGEDKIAAIGIRVRRWVSYHGVSINLNPDLSHYDGIVPCGVTEHGVTSLAKLGVNISMDELAAAMQSCFTPLFGPVAPSNF